MRKFTLLLAALLLVGGAAFASDVTVSGSVSAGWGFGDAVYGELRERSEVKVTAVVDEINTAVVSFRYAGTTAAGVRDGYIVTNLGAALGLEGQTLKIQVGQYEADNFNVSTVTGMELEDVADGWGTRDGHIQLDYAFGSVFKLRGVVGPGDGDAMDGMVAVASAFGPVEVEAFFSDDGNKKPEDGNVGFGLAFSQEVVPGTVDLSVGADFVSFLGATGSAPAFAFGVGASAGLMDGMATVGVSFKGEDGKEADALGFDLNVAPVAFAGLDLGVAIGLDSAYQESFNSLEASAYLKPGAATYRLGYAFYDGTKDGATIKTDYKSMGKIAGAESGFMFFNVSLSY
jgi:hypothetical protein